GGHGHSSRSRRLPETSLCRTVNLSIVGRRRRFSEMRLPVPYRHGPLVPIAVGAACAVWLFGAIPIGAPDCRYSGARVGARSLVAEGCEEVAKHVKPHYGTIRARHSVLTPQMAEPNTYGSRSAAMASRSRGRLTDSVVAKMKSPGKRASHGSVANADCA